MLSAVAACISASLASKFENATTVNRPHIARVESTYRTATCSPNSNAQTAAAANSQKNLLRRRLSNLIFLRRLIGSTSLRLKRRSELRDLLASPALLSLWCTQYIRQCFTNLLSSFTITGGRNWLHFDSNRGRHFFSFSPFRVVNCPIKFILQWPQHYNCQHRANATITKPCYHPPMAGFFTVLLS